MKYKVIIREIHEKEVLIDSENEYQALDIAQEQYDNWDIILDDPDHAKVTFKCGEWSINRPKTSSKHHSKPIEEEKEDIRTPKTVEDVLLHKLNIDNSKLNLSDIATMSNIPEFKLKLKEIKRIKEIPTYCNHKCYLISKSDDYHIIYIPDNVTLLNDYDIKGIWEINCGKAYERIFTDQIEDLEGTLKIIGGKNLKNINGLFAYCKAQSLDLSNFNTPNITEMRSTFHDSCATSIDFTNFDTSNVTNMEDMFFCSHVKSLDLSSFNTSKVVNMNYMFACTDIDSLDLSNFDTSNVIDMGGMFLASEGLFRNLSSFDTSNVTTMDEMFVNYNQYDDSKDFKNSIIEINPEKFFAADIKNIKSAAAFSDCKAQIKCVDPIHGTHFIDARELTNLESLYHQYHSDLTEKDNDEYQYD